MRCVQASVWISVGNVPPAVGMLLSALPKQGPATSMPMALGMPLGGADVCKHARTRAPRDYARSSRDVVGGCGNPEAPSRASGAEAGCFELGKLPSAQFLSAFLASRSTPTKDRGVYGRCGRKLNKRLAGDLSGALVGPVGKWLRALWMLAWLRALWTLAWRRALVDVGMAPGPGGCWHGAGPWWMLAWRRALVDVGMASVTSQAPDDHVPTRLPDRYMF